MSSATGTPQGRYVLPSFTERTSYGIKEMDPFNKLFQERIVFLGVQVDDTSANDVIAQLLTLETLDPDRDISIYINSPGGSFTSMTGIYDTMNFIRPEIQTVCLGQAASAAALILAAGTPGKRLALPHCRIMLHQPGIEGASGQSSDLEIVANEILRMRELLEDALAKHTGRPVGQIRDDLERDKFYSADEAKEYGLIDDVVSNRTMRPASRNRR
ncbi:ATP-dependent Clp protease proteolytic subunit [Spirillospora sp. NPDC048911]|uniref:ATP-dependent Clp protease proteolytic subunit n=1 Tax=Spirillospora sp. NPDC048911 TaxID=3364527 RepID=UPI00371B5A2B